jgi:hypothetical protein
MQTQLGFALQSAPFLILVIIRHIHAHKHVLQNNMDQLQLNCVKIALKLVPCALHLHIAQHAKHLLLLR